MLQRFITFWLIAPLVVIFSVSSLKEAAVYFRNMLTVWNPWVLFDGSLCDMGMSATDWKVIIFSGIILLAVSALRENGYDCKFIVKQNAAFKMLLGLTLFFAIMIFGMYGAQFSASAFVYAGF